MARAAPVDGLDVSDTDVDEAEMRIAIVGHIRLYREGLAYALSKNAAMEVVTVAANLMDVTELLRSQSVDVVLIDAAAPGYLDLGQQLRELFRVILVGLAVEEVDTEVIACAEAGFCSYVPRDASVNQLADAIHAAAKGQLYCPPNIAGMLLRRISALASNRSQGMKIPHLTARELEIARLLDHAYFVSKSLIHVHI